LIYRASPFSKVEKLLLIAGYFLFWEYFVISRSYALMVLCGFSYVALRARLPNTFWPAWLALGLLANSVLFGTIWSIALAALFMREWRRSADFVVGAAIYAALLLLAIATMMPASDIAFGQAELTLRQIDLAPLAAYPINAFDPIQRHWLIDAAGWLGHPMPGQTVVRYASGATFIHAISLGYTSIAIAALLAPFGLVLIMAGDNGRRLEFIVTYIGVLLFVQLWHFHGTYRHQGILFIAFVGAVWASRAVHPRPGVLAFALWLALLAANAFAGVLTLSSEVRPFSQARSVAEWLQRNHLADAPIIGIGDVQTSAVAGYLRRPIYYTTCECMGTFIVWNTKRLMGDRPSELTRRILRGIDALGRNEAVLILSTNYALPSNREEASFRADLLQRFTGALQSDENYSIYLLRRREPTAPSGASEPHSHPP
jgi:hypothetical protein